MPTQIILIPFLVIIFNSVLSGFLKSSLIGKKICTSLIISLVSSLLFSFIGFLIGLFFLQKQYLADIFRYTENTNFKTIFSPNIIFFVILIATIIALIIKKYQKNTTQISNYLVIINSRIFFLLKILIPFLIIRTLYIFFTTTKFNIFFDFLYLILIFFIGYVLQYIIIIFGISFLTKYNFYNVINKTKKTFLKVVLLGASKFLIPQASQDLKNNFEVDEDVADIILPIVALFSTAGLALYLGIVVSISFNLGLFNLTYGNFIIVFLNILICSVGCGGIQNGALIVLPIIFNVVNLDLNLFSIFVLIDVFINPIRSAINLLNDIFIVIFFNLFNKKLWHKKFI